MSMSMSMWIWMWMWMNEILLLFVSNNSSKELQNDQTVISGSFDRAIGHIYISASLQLPHLTIMIQLHLPFHSKYEELSFTICVFCSHCHHQLLANRTPKTPRNDVCILLWNTATAMTYDSLTNHEYLIMQKISSRQCYSFASITFLLQATFNSPVSHAAWMS